MINSVMGSLSAPRIRTSTDIATSKQYPWSAGPTQNLITMFGLTCSINRYYDPTTGQFMSVDPFADQTGSPYSYTGGDPINGVDPLGLNWLTKAWDDTGGKVVHEISTHGVEIGLIAGGVVLLAGATVLTGGLSDVIWATGAGLAEEGSDLEVAELATHIPFVLLPGITVGGFGLASIGYGIYGWISGPKSKTSEKSLSANISSTVFSCR